MSTVEVTDINGKKHFFTSGAIAQVSEAGVSQRWHGIQANLKLFDGTTLEVRESAQELVKKL